MSGVAQLIEKMSAEDELERRKAARMLGQRGDEEAIPILVQGLRDSSRGVQEAAIEALIKLRGRRAVKELIPLLRENDASLRNMAIEILREIGEDGLDILLHLLRDEVSDVRIFVADILGNTGDHRAVDGLIALLNDPVDNVRNQAIISLGQLKDKRVIPALLEVGERGNEWTKFAVIEALSQLGGAQIIDSLLNYLEDENELIKKASLEALGKTGHPKAAPHLVKALREVDGGTKKGIVRNLVENFRGKLSSCLTEGQRSSLVATLMENLDEDDLIFNFKLIETVGNLKVPQATGPLIGLLEHPNGLIKIAACRGLGMTGDPAALQHLFPLTRGPDEDLCQAAQEAIGRIRGDGKR